MFVRACVRACVGRYRHGSVGSGSELRNRLFRSRRNPRNASPRCGPGAVPPGRQCRARQRLRGRGRSVWCRSLFPQTLTYLFSPTDTVDLWIMIVTSSIRHISGYSVFRIHHTYIHSFIHSSYYTYIWCVIRIEKGVVNLQE